MKLKSGTKHLLFLLKEELAFIIFGTLISLGAGLINGLAAWLKFNPQVGQTMGVGLAGLCVIIVFVCSFFHFIAVYDDN